MATRDIRITRLEGRVKTLEDVQEAMLNKLDKLIANQASIIVLIEALMKDIAEIKERIFGRPIGFIQDDE